MKFEAYFLADVLFSSHFSYPNHMRDMNTRNTFKFLVILVCANCKCSAQYDNVCISLGAA